MRRRRAAASLAALLAAIVAIVASDRPAWPGVAVAHARSASRARAAEHAARAEALTAEQRAAVDAVRACARDGGGWTYVCNPPTGPHGVVTKILVRARQVQSLLGGARWDVLVMRSPGTPAAGLVLLEAWRRDGDARDLEVARRAGDLLVETQLPSGGWASEMPVVGGRLARWFRWLNQWTALDDDVTSGGARFLLALWSATGDATYRAAAERALALLLDAQLDGGAWPLTWRPAWLRRLSPSFEDLPSTNDGATAGQIAALLDAAARLSDERYLAAARRGGDWLLAVQGAPPLAAWAQQYERDGRPAAGRSFEPPGLAAWESREMQDALWSIARATGDRTYCRGSAAAVAWLVSSQIEPGCWARLYEPGDGRPLYVDRAGRRVASAAEAKRPYKWRGDFGIPGLLGEVGLASDGSPLAPGAAPPPRRIFGDAGACRDRTPLEEAPDEENPRARIVRAAVLLQRGAVPPLSPCADDVAAASAAWRAAVAPPAGTSAAGTVEAGGDSR